MSINDKVVGTCGNCGGPVTVPAVWHGTVPPVPTCRNCRAVAKQDHGPVMPMEPSPKATYRFKVEPRPRLSIAPLLAAGLGFRPRFSANGKHKSNGYYKERNTDRCPVREVPKVAGMMAHAQRKGSAS